MKKKLKLSKYKACLCEGGAETAIMEILLDNNLNFPGVFSKHPNFSKKLLLF